MPPEPGALSREVVAALVRGGLTVATAESLTGGLVCARLTDVEGASAVVRGAVVAYATDVKCAVLGVDEAVLRRHGAVSPETAAAMAAGARAVIGADLGVATTGVAGPDGQEGHPAGTVHVAVAGEWDTRVVSRTGAGRLGGDRAAVRSQTVALVLELLLAHIGARES